MFVVYGCDADLSWLPWRYHYPERGSIRIVAGDARGAATSGVRLVDAGIFDAGASSSLP